MGASALAFALSSSPVPASARQEVTLWQQSGPAGPDAAAADPKPVTVGVEFVSAVDGQVDGLRFFKGPGNAGTHVGTLWGSSGQALAEATFVNETATGWQEVLFAQPVAISANATYLASYFAPQGNYAATEWSFGGGGVTSGPLHALNGSESINGVGNGVYSYSDRPAFPTKSFAGSNYWVDVMFHPGNSDPSTTTSTTTPDTTSTTTASTTTTTTRDTTTTTPDTTTSTTTPDTTTSTTVPDTTTSTTVPDTTTTTAGGGGGLPKCPINLDPSCNWPGPSNTGVPNGTSLTPLRAGNVPQTQRCSNNQLNGTELDIYCDGTVVDGYRIDGTVVVSASNVVIQNTYISDHTTAHDHDTIKVDYHNPSASLTMQDSEATCYGNQGYCAHIIGYSNYTLLRVNFHDATDAIAFDNGNTDIRDSWLHDVYTCEAYAGSCGIHADVVQKTEGSHDKLIHNYISNSQGDGTSGLQCCTDQGPVSDFVVADNLFNAPGYEMYGGFPGQNPMTAPILYENNHFMRAPEGFWSLTNGALYGANVYTNYPGVITWSGNVWDDTGAVLGA